MRRAQGAIEYLFMIAAALIIVAVVIKYLRSTGNTAGSQVESTVQNASSEISNAIKEEIQSQLNNTTGS
ncbi:class III signal peptide-containing protein [Pyrococcus kukulkanii]|uniref:class III signal peptide-containing protein n=1 Tax=Pyrococcus kukulkanii TaxID=1609559 RepID=UPI003569BB66